MTTTTNTLRRLAPLLLTLAAPLCVEASPGLVGRWLVEGSDERGAYQGEAQIDLDAEGASVTLTIEGEDASEQLGGRLPLSVAAPRQVEVTARRLNARAAPRNGAVETQFSLGAVLTVLEEQRGWLRVAHDQGSLWISGRFTKPVTAAPAGGDFDCVLSPPTGLAGTITGLAADEDESPADGRETRYRWVDADQLEATFEGGQERWLRVPEGASRLVRFVLAGTERPIASARVRLGAAAGEDLSTTLRLETNAAGIAALPEGFEQESCDRGWFLTAGRPDRAPALADSTELGEDAFSGAGIVTIPLRYTGPRWQEMYEHMLTVTDIVGSGRFSWNKQTESWDTPILDCITTALYAASAATELGARGLHRGPGLDNMVRDRRGRSMVENSCYKRILSPVFGSASTMRRLAGSGSVYRGVCRWPWKHMEWGWTGTQRCGCGAHATPRDILDNKDQLGRLNILSMSQAKRPAGPDHGPMSGWTMRYEYSVLLLIKRDDGSLYTYHASTSHDPERRCKTFVDEVENWATDSYGTKETDVRYLVWKVDDAQIPPFFWLGDDGEEFTPEHILEKLAIQPDPTQTPEEPAWEPAAAP